jgi:outer membrane protein OmpA-like peptidoglycan-associated protein
MAVNRALKLCILVFSLCLGATTLHAQDELRTTFFKEADAAKAAADAADAKLLAPRSYERGMKEYRDAEVALERGRNIETVRSNAADATRYFKTATSAAELADVKLAQVMKSRQDAANSETRRLLADADRARVGRYAPITLSRAKQLLANAERELNDNRYDTDLPRSLAKEANYEAKHAIYLSEVVRKVRDKDLTAEQLVLEWEKAFRDVAGAADVVPDMEAGPDKLTAELIAFIDAARIENQALAQEKAENETRLAELQEELAALDERLGGATAERAALVQRLEAQARVKEQFERVEKMFTPAEARVFREGNNIILRLVGLTFDSGNAQIKPETFDLLAKVEKAIDVFPRSELIIEGHTDSFGGDDSNQKLSQTRAEAVQQYMINAMRIPTYRLIATGYGETRPIASNETESGRQRNRRIDIVIRPNLDQN